MKRVLLFVLTNLAVIFVLSIVTSLLGVEHWLTENGIDYYSLLVFAAVFGFGGAFISLLVSKPVAKWSVGAKVITSPRNQEEQWVLDTVNKLADRVNLPRPEVAIYEGDANAFATGASKSNSLVAVSTGLLRNMTRDEVEAVLGHEIAHIKNGDMVTLTLIQGVLNTFVIFAARVVGFIVDNAIRRGEGSGTGIGYMFTVIIFQILFGILASIIVMYFSRQREFRADSGASDLLGSNKSMIAALQRLGSIKDGELPKAIAAFGIAGGSKPGGFRKLFMSHPPLEERIEALRNANSPVKKI